jgi:EAL domain-containing protein (putative c-di-GMP-specific phosphodiesterase class I)
LTVVADKDAVLRLGETLDPVYFTQEVTDLTAAPVRAVETLLRFRDARGKILHFTAITNDPSVLELADDTRVVFQRAQKAVSSALFDSGYTYVGLNITTHHLLDENWLLGAEELCSFVARDYPGHGIVFEIIETPTSEGITGDLLLDALQRLRQLGAQFAIDDFGKLGSSMLRLCQLHLEYVKLDRGLAEVALCSGFARDLISALVKECQSHGVTVIAEGVETKAMSDAWLDLNVSLQQGFLFDQPKQRL